MNVGGGGGVCVCLYTVCLLTGYLTVATVAIEMAVGVCVCDITAFLEYCRPQKCVQLNI